MRQTSTKLNTNINSQLSTITAYISLVKKQHADHAQKNKQAVTDKTASKFMQ